MKVTAEQPSKGKAIVNGLSMRTVQPIEDGGKDFDVIISRFASITEYYERIEANIDHRVEDRIHASFTASFLGRNDIRSLADVGELRSKKDEKLLRTIDRKIEELDSELPDPTEIKRSRTFDEFDGDEVDYDRLRSGQEFWHASEKRETTGVQNVIINIQQNASGMTDSKSIADRCATAIALAKKLESAGYGVEVNVFNYNTNVFDGLRQGSNNRLLTIIPAKTFDQGLDIVGLANLTAPWMFRTYTFADRAITGLMFGGQAGYGMGSTVEIDSFAIEQIENGIDTSTTKVINFGKLCLNSSTALNVARLAIASLETQHEFA